MSGANPRRDQALANYQAIQQHHFHSTVEKAMGELLVALAEETAAPASPAELAEIRQELAALRRELAASRTAPATAIEPAELAEIRQELTALRRDLMFVSSLDPAAATPPSAEVAELRQEIAGLRKEMARFMRQNTLGVVPPPRGQPARPARDLPGKSAPMRPVEELLDDAPQIEGELSSDQLKDYIQRPRVRPEDITLTREDIKRQERRALLPISGETFARLGRQSQPANQANNAVGVILLIIFVVIMAFSCGMMLIQ